MDGLKDKTRPWELDLSIVIPLKDEDQSVLPLKNEIGGAMKQLPYSWKCLWVDDGATDKTLSEIQRFPQQDPAPAKYCLSVQLRSISRAVCRVYPCPRRDHRHPRYL